MRAFALILISVGVCGFAAADGVRFYFTSSSDSAGLADPTHAFDDTDGLGADGASYRLADELPEIGVPTIDPTMGEYLYVWMEFEGTRDGRRVRGINVVFNDRSFAGEQTETDRGLYLGDDTDPEDGSGEKLRWELTSKTDDPATLSGIRTPGIENWTTDGWLYRGSEEGRRIALLGAIAVDAPADGKPYELRMGLGSGGIDYRGGNGDIREPDVWFGNNDERIQRKTYSTDADAVVVPEPASIGLMLVAGALRRRGGCR